MILILLSYVFTLYILLGNGIIFSKWIRLENYNLIYTFITGLFFQLITASFYAIFYPLDAYFFLINIILSTLFITFNFYTVKKTIYKTTNTFFNFSKSSKILFLSIIITSLLYSSSLPFLVDNETYYIQTIKWLNNYGLVKGLANLHLFLGQTSGWHILQSSFNFSFIASNFNDLNGLFIIITTYFCLEKWEIYKSKRNKNDLLIALITSTLIFLFLFIASPSPDLPIIIIIPIIIHLFIESFQNRKSDYLNLITVLTLLAILIKVTVAPILVLLLFVLVKTKDFKKWRFAIILSAISLFSFNIKNIIITGYPLYPLAIGNELINVDWKLNFNLQQVSYQWGSMDAWQMSNWKEFLSLNPFNKFWIWLNLPGLDGLLNKIIVVFMLVFPFFNFKKKEMRYLYIYFLIQCIALYITSPQYRFFLPVLLSIGLIILAHLLHHRLLTIKILFALNIVILITLGVFGLNFNGIMNNDIMSKKYPITPSQLISPRAITQFENLEFTKYQLQNLTYFSPSKDSVFFWQTSDGPLPCANKKMIQYFSMYYNHIPQMRTKNLKDGFLTTKPNNK